ncbi:MAG: anthranilate phosphoribosyltransferase [Lentisphaeria bacterium]|nr:anthranilate phosphoribosyltransferase [Lentisphaeria bacterium]MDY0176354.1 anthranilate phosphoribosyltransferase [Lentisphaeria bacterium]NLZ60010.1 anthranilate phosphoribosyltransferase [Lentisphaerota bacterium]
MLKAYLEKIFSRRDLEASEMDQLLGLLVNEEVSNAQAGALLAAMRMKGESVSELVGAAQMLRRNATFIDCGAREVVDVVGTGGDGGVSFNVSTTSALVAAGAGVPIAKHGNRAVSGKCGSADVLAELGFNLLVEPARMEQCICEHGIGFMFAQKMHPQFGKLAPLRRELGFRSIFNMLGPLCNPAGATRMLVGVFAPELCELFAAALLELGVKHAMVVHGNDGLDEISCCQTTRVCELKEGRIFSYELYPELLLGESFTAEEIVGGEVAENAAILSAVINGTERGACRAISVLNAGAACYLAGLADDLPEGIKMAEQSIEQGRAAEKLQILIEESQS